MIVNGNNKLLKSSVQAVLSTVIHAIDDNQLIRLYTVGEKNENHLIIDAYINCLQNDKNDFTEAISLYTSFSQTIMAINGGVFSIKIEDQKSYSFKWTFKNY
ncbi:MAG: hypothetical protein JEZ14_15580 [Marinilabiliaceae bacterium]|nr:hypothetical protein [Marinilabiliaceae bacterium]